MIATKMANDQGRSGTASLPDFVGTVLDFWGADHTSSSNFWIFFALATPFFKRHVQQLARGAMVSGMHSVATYRNCIRTPGFHLSLPSLPSRNSNRYNPRDRTAIAITTIAPSLLSRTPRFPYNRNCRWVILSATGVTGAIIWKSGLILKWNDLVPPLHEMRWTLGQISFPNKNFDPARLVLARLTCYGMKF